MSGRLNWERAAQRDKLQGPPFCGYWITVFDRGAPCADCGNSTTVMAYRHIDQHALCEACWIRVGLEPRPSRRYLAWQKQVVRHGDQQENPSKRRRRRRRQKSKRTEENVWLSPEERQMVAEARAKQRRV